ncbi:hypothetical protein V8G54_015842 [Vigna mungo]|uniref:Uncharacterized protein n=1 Tax=Vigna mungo TaxID=3915 RepID=A0AAQ3RYS6_VIGMU
MLYPGSNCFQRSASRILSEHGWVEGDALDLPFMDGWFDASTMGYGSRVSILDFNKSNESLTSAIMVTPTYLLMIGMDDRQYCCTCYLSGYGLAAQIFLPNPRSGFFLVQVLCVL